MWLGSPTSWRHTHRSLLKPFLTLKKRFCQWQMRVDYDQQHYAIGWRCSKALRTDHSSCVQVDIVRVQYSQVHWGPGGDTEIDRQAEPSLIHQPLTMGSSTWCPGETLPLWFTQCNMIWICAQVEEKLMERLSAGIIAWKDCLTGALQEDSIDTTMDTTTTAPQAQFRLGGIPELEVF